MPKKKKNIDYEALTTDQVSILIGGFTQGSKSSICYGGPDPQSVATKRFTDTIESLAKLGMVTTETDDQGFVTVTGTDGHMIGIGQYIAPDPFGWIEEHSKWEMFVSSKTYNHFNRNNTKNLKRTDNEFQQV